MNNLKNFINDIKSFNNWDFSKSEASKTQKRGTFVEEYIEGKFKRNFDNAIIQKIGSQGHPDFFIFNKEDHINFLQNFNNKIEQNKKIGLKKDKNVTGVTRKMILDWEKNTNFNIKKSKLIRFEIKTKISGKIYKLNDTFISSEYNEIYVFADFLNEKLYLNTTFDMISREGDIKKYTRLKKEFEKMKEEFRSNWTFKNIQSYPRPNLQINEKYASFDSEIERIEKIFKEANIKIN